MGRFVSYGGGISASSYVGGPPEDRTWRPEHPVFAPEIHWSARIEAFASVDGGKDQPTFIGARSWIFKHAHVGHDAWIGEDVEVSTGAIIGGHCQIGDGVKIGLNATIKPFVKIGAGARIGMGAVVICDVPAGRVFAGNPARDLRPPATDSELVKTCC